MGRRHADSPVMFIDKSHNLDFLDDSGSEDDGFAEEATPSGPRPNWPLDELRARASIPIDSLLTTHKERRDTTFPDKPFISSSSGTSTAAWTPSYEQHSLSHWHAPRENALLEPPSSTSKCLWPLQDENEVTLLLHFATELCLWVSLSALLDLFSSLTLTTA